MTSECSNFCSARSWDRARSAPYRTCRHIPHRCSYSTALTAEKVGKGARPRKYNQRLLRRVPRPILRDRYSHVHEQFRLDPEKTRSTPPSHREIHPGRKLWTASCHSCGQPLRSPVLQAVSLKPFQRILAHHLYCKCCPAGSQQLDGV